MKWTALNKDKINQFMNGSGRNKQIVMADSGDWTTTESEYLPGGIINII